MSTMENTTNFSVRTQTNTLNQFDSIIKQLRLSRSKVIESFMIQYIDNYRNNRQSNFKLAGELSKYRGVASKLTSDMVKDDPRAKHALGYE